MPAMLEFDSPEDYDALLQDIVSKVPAGTLAKQYGCTVQDLRDFVERNRDTLQRMRDSPPEAPPETSAEPSPTQLSELWISNKFERLVRLQRVADILYRDITGHAFSGAELTMAVREFRSYTTVVANELGQLLHRGAGDNPEGDTLAVEFQGIDMGALQ